MDKIRVMLANGYPIIRTGLRALIGTEDDMAVVAEAEDGASGCELAAELGPDVLIVDTSGRCTDAIVGAMRPLSRRPGIGVLMLADRDGGADLRASLKAGACGYVLNRTPTDELLRAIRAVARGGTYLDSAAATRLVRGFLGDPSGPMMSDGCGLSGREEEVLRLIASGHTSKEIAGRLGISVKTVETHKARSMEKLGIGSRPGIIKYAADHGWLSRA